MADSGAVRARRARAHKAGDHSQCRHEGPSVGVASLPPEPVTDAQGELAALAGRLVAASVADPGNAALARELRATLLALGGQGVPADDELAEMLGAFRRP